jgi:hypothetical protein
VPAPVAFALAVGEPSLGRYAGGRFDLAVPVTFVVLLLFTMALGIRLRWPMLIGLILASPPLVALAHSIGYPMTAGLFLTLLGTASAVVRHGRQPGRP